MGNSYTNITLATDDQAKVIKILKKMKRRAYIAQPQNGYTVIFDEACEDQDIDILKKLAFDLSKSLACAVFATLNHDDDVLVYYLYKNEEIVDSYASPNQVGYHVPVETTKNWDKFCEVLGVPEQTQAVSKILSRARGWGIWRSYAVEIDRHNALVEALKLPAFTAGLGYDYIEGGDSSQFGVSEQELAYVE